MSEKVIIKSKRNTHIKEIPTVLIIIGLILGFVGFNGGKVFSSGSTYIALFIVGLLIALIGFVAWLYVGNCSVTIAENKLVGVAAFGKKIDISISDITSVTLLPFDTLSIYTNKDNIKFIGLSNKRDLYNTINKLLEK